jgi:hypothetical protein
MADYNPGSGKQIAEEVEHVPAQDYEKTAYAMKADAIEAENAEHNMTVLEAVRAYPMASFWAFVMSCTIVGHGKLPGLRLMTNTSVDHGILRCFPDG